MEQLKASMKEEKTRTKAKEVRSSVAELMRAPPASGKRCILRSHLHTPVVNGTLVAYELRAQLALTTKQSISLPVPPVQ